jgi:hypothetical protein
MVHVAPSSTPRQRCGSPDRVLVGRPSQPPELYWVSADAAKVLELLAHDSLDDVVFAQRWNVQPVDATERLNGLLSDLYVTGLVKIRDTAGGGS